MERKRRTFSHKGKIRFKHRIPRKLKKQIKIEFGKRYELRKIRLMKIYGDLWFEHVIIGG